MFFFLIFRCRLSRLTKITFVVSVFVTYGLQFYVPVNILWPKIEHRLSSPRAKSVGNVVFRILLILFTGEYLLHRYMYVLFNLL